MSLTKEQVHEKIKELYVFNASLDENDVKKKRKKLYKDVLEQYRNWERALQASGISKRKIREREKFMLYFLLKGRLEKYGPEAIRPINIKPFEVKERIVQSFKTLKALKDIVLEWNEEKVLYELHAFLLCGMKIEHIEREQPELYEQMMEYFNDLDDALLHYNKRFGLPTITTELVQKNAPTHVEQVEKKTIREIKTALPVEETPHDIISAPAVGQSDDLIDMMIKLNYIDNQEDAKAIIQANQLGKEEVVHYLFQALAHAQKSGVKLTEQGMRQEEPALYFAMKAHYKNLENALHEITMALVDIQ